MQKLMTSTISFYRHPDAPAWSVATISWQWLLKGWDRRSPGLARYQHLCLSEHRFDCSANIGTVDLTDITFDDSLEGGEVNFMNSTPDRTPSQIELRLENVTGIRSWPFRTDGRIHDQAQDPALRRPTL